MCLLKELRREKWRTRFKWDEKDLWRRISSNDALAEMEQDFEIPMVLTGGDVVNL